MKRAKESGCYFRKKRKTREEELKKNEGAILKFVRISSHAISSSEMHDVSSAGTSESIPEVGEETAPGQIRNHVEADVESNISKAYAAESRNDVITIIPNYVASWPELINHDIRVELVQWFPTGEEFLPREEFHEFRGGISTFYLSYLFVVQ